jgi:transcriptional regulator with XRE-family HTH domain
MAGKLGRPIGQRKYANQEELQSLVYTALQERELSAAKAAEQAGINPAHLSKFLRAKKAIAKGKLEALATILGVSSERLLLAAGYSGTDVNRYAPGVDDVIFSRESFKDRTLLIFSDPRFFDSCLFLSLFQDQPLREYGINCQLEPCEWRSTPFRVSDASWSVGFYNRRAVPTIGNRPIVSVSYWTDLCLYCGYALVAAKRHDTRNYDLTKLPGALTFLSDLRKKFPGKKRPVIVTIGTDTVWRLQNSLTGPELGPNNFVLEVIEDPDVALNQFLGGTGDLFIGGLPQRLVATGKPHNLVEVLNFANNPLLFSLNSLIYSSEYEKSPPISVLAAITGLWYRAIDEARDHAEYRQQIIKQCTRLAQNYRSTTTWPDPIHFDALLAQTPEQPARSRYELFAAKPTELSDAITNDIVSAVFLAVRDNPKVDIDQVVADLRRTLTPSVKTAEMTALSTHR